MEMTCAYEKVGQLLNILALKHISQMCIKDLPALRTRESSQAERKTEFDHKNTHIMLMDEMYGFHYWLSLWLKPIEASVCVCMFYQL